MENVSLNVVDYEGIR